MKNLVIACLLLTLSGCSTIPSTAPSTVSSTVSSTSAHCQTAKVVGMTCEVCASTVSENLKKIPGVEDVSVDVATGTVKIYTDGQKIESATVKHIIERSGYKFQTLQNSCAK
jgi:copper chaperone